jgi:hypothetical protein
MMAITARLSSPGTIGKVSVRSSNRTTIADPKFKPDLDVSIFDLNDVSLTTRQEGDVLVYDVINDDYVSAPITDALIDIRNINGGAF